MVLDVLGVRILDMTGEEALALMEGWIRDPARPTRPLFIVNTHTLNLAFEDPEYRRILNSAEAVFGDGTGVRWAARMQGIRVRDNLNGTDLVPRFFAATSGRGWRYYLLGNDPSSIERAAASARERFPGWVQAGFHHGYLRPEDGPAAVERINQARPDLLLVGMGNPRQERWIHDHRASLRVPLCIGVGGLFDYWAGNIRRTAPWVRRLGMEWLGLLAQQPHKLRRYGVGNPKFLLRATRQALGRRAGA